MLKGIDPLLGPELLQVLRAMGHGDEIAIVDANYPADAHARRCVRADGLSAPRMLDAILSVLPLDHAVAKAAFTPAPAGPSYSGIFEEFAEVVQKYDSKIDLAPLTGDDFYDRVQSSYALVATGERRLHGNILLRKGVIFPDTGKKHLKGNFA